MQGKRLACLTLCLMVLLAACNRADEPADPVETPQDNAVIDERNDPIADSVDFGWTVAIEIIDLPAGEYVYYGPYEVGAGNTIERELRARGEGLLHTGFSITEDYTNSYWTQMAEGEDPALSHNMTVQEAFSNSYYIWVGNGGDEPLHFVEGFVRIEPN